MVQKKSEAQRLQERIRDLEQQLVNAQAAILALRREKGQNTPSESPAPARDLLFSNGEGVKQVLQVVPYPLMIWREDGRVLMVNTAFTEITGYDLDDIPTFEEWSHKAFGPHVLEHPSLVFYEEFPGQDVKKSREFEITIRSGEKRIWDFSNAVLGTDQEDRWLMISMAVDITERREIEGQLAENEHKFSIIFDKAPFAAALSKLPAGVITHINEEFERVFGYTRQEVLGKTSIEVGINPDPESRARILEQIQTQGSARNVEARLQTKSGQSRTFLLNLDQVSIEGEKYVLQTAQDITEQKQAEKDLKESEQRYRGLFEQMQEGLVAAEVITDECGTPINYRYLDVNPATERQFGIPREQFIGHTYTEVLPEGDQEWIKILGQVALTGEPASVERFGRASKKWFEAHAYSPRPGQFVSILTDITERKKAEEALRKSEERFSKAFHSSPDAIIISRMSDGLIIEANETWSELFGHDLTEVLGHTSIELDLFVNPEDRKEAVRRILEHDSVRNFELEIRKKSGEIRLASLSAEKIEVNGDAALLTVLRDITERKRAEEQIAYQARLLASVNDAIVGSDAEYRLTVWNTAAETIYGWKAEEVLGRNGLEILQTEWPREKAEEMRHRIAETGRWRGEATQRRKDGKHIPVEISSMVLRNEQGDITGYVSVNRDITERQKVEQALRESEKRFRSLADSMPQLVWTALPDGRVDYYNQRHLEYQNIKQLQREDWEWAPVLHPDDTQATVDAWLHSVETGDTYQIEHRVRMRDGSFRWHLSRGIPMLDERGQVIRWFGTATDIHDLKLAEEKLKIYASRLEKSNRELEQFAFMASHDLQEPLRKIEMFGDLLLQRAQDLQENERAYLDRMRNAAGRMRDMIEGLLQISRVATEGRSFVRVDMSRLTQEVLSDFEDQIRNSEGKVEVGRLPAVTGDPLQLRQLMQNLIGNALKYHQRGKPPEVRIFAEKLPEKVQICVQDKGIGFPQEDADRIFEPFQRLVGRNEYAGSGIGLAICRRIVERHDGEIGAISEPGQGTLFIITLPKPPVKKSK